MTDRKWNTQSVMATLNASNHSKWERADMDYYATPPLATKMLLELEWFSKTILEPACWEWHISEILKENWYSVVSSDIIDRWYWNVQDYLEKSELDVLWWNGDIITNPPYTKANEFVTRSMEIMNNWWKLAMLLRVQFLEWVARHKLFEKYPPKTIYVSSRTIRCAKNWDFKNATGNASTYCWFIREKGFKWDPSIKWFNYNK